MYLSWFLVLGISVSPGLTVYHNDILKRNTYKFPDLRDDALFGFSVSSMATGINSKLIVGAPKQDDIGEVYTCDPTTGNCLPVSKNGIHRFNEDDRYNNQSYWFGATVSGTEDFFVACAPRFVANRTIDTITKVGIFGRCYSYDDKGAGPTLLNSVPQYLLETTQPFETTMETFGWTLNIDDIDDSTSIYIGGPGMGSGRLMRIKSNKVGARDYAYGKYSKFNASFNFGYSVTTGEFKTTGKNPRLKTQVAVGSTYGSDGRGKVIFRPYTDISMSSTNELVGPTVGSMYGAALCTASFKENGKRSALLVGAPAFADYDGYNTGAVYVYTVAKKDGFLPNPITMFPGEAPNSFFGSAILNVGDLNGDQKDEIAIAAPYFENIGCVYLYSGAHLAIAGNKPIPLQKIHPSPGIRTFGYSLGLVKDYDENGCDELAIGAPESNEVTVLNCIAVITVKLLKLPNVITKGKGDEPKFLKVCFDVQFPVKPKKVNADIDVKIAIQHDGASLQVPTDGLLKFKIDQKNETLICKKIMLFLNGTGKYNKAISYNMKATHIRSKDKDFRPENVNLSIKSELSIAGLIWAQECGNGTCLPRLEMSANYSEESPYLIGSKPSIETLISVMNTGDVAYDACMHINVSGAGITKLPNNCHALASDSLECRPRQPVYKGPNWDQDISIDTTALTNENRMISVNMKLFYECGNASRTVSDGKYFTLNADADSIHIQRRTDEGVDNMVNLTRGDIAAHKQFHHVYKIVNNGLTNWVNVPIVISVPKLDIATAAVYVADRKCKLTTPFPNETIYNCITESIPKISDKEVKIIFTVVPDPLNAKIGQEEITVYSKINVILNGIVKPAEVKSELRLVEAVIPIWIIIAASILALLILLIIFFILRECGCLKRKNKEELKRVRMSVRRQTMMRKSMMARPPSEDQETLVREAEASHESDKKKKDRRVIINDF